jgi:C1A family cysteine protease
MVRTKKQKHQEKHGMGYIPDLPHVEDLTVKSASEQLPNGLLRSLAKPTNLPKNIDNSKYDSPVDNQLNIGSCTAEGIVATVEHMEKKAFGKHIDASVLFTYWNTRSMMGEEYIGVDSGAYNRTAIKSVVKVGLLDDSLWPYDTSTFANEPTRKMYTNMQSYDVLSYIRLDSSYGQSYVDRMRSFVFHGYPLFTGFVAYDDIWNVTKQQPVLQYPTVGVSKEVGGHAVMISGYDDEIESNSGSKGAFRIKNSWGTDWGDSGYFWIPYKYFNDGIALDTWAITGMRYIDTKEFD